MTTNFKIAKVLGCLLVAQIFAAQVNSAELVVDDGVVIKFGADAQLLVRDKLQLGKGVVLTGQRDDAALGKIGNAAQIATAGDWRGVRIEKTATTLQVNDAAIRFAGAQGGAGLMVRGQKPSLAFLQLTDNTVGLRLDEGAAANLTGASFLRNGVGVQANGGATATITSSQFYQNSSYAVFNQTPTTSLQATGNWWGHLSGPKDSVANPNGLGDAVSTGVVYSAYLGAAPLLNPSVRLVSTPSYFDVTELELDVACQNAIEFRIAEGSAFSGVPFQALSNGSARTRYTVSAGDGLKNINVQFRNAAGDVVTTALSTAVRIDTQGPSLSITNPANGSQITRSITVEATASDSAGVAKVEFWVDGTLVSSKTTAPYSYPWNVSQLQNGNHVIKMVAYDTVGHSSQIESNVVLAKLVSSYTEVVPATSNIFGAGHTVPPTGGGSGGNLPNQFSFAAQAGQVLSFVDVSGSVTCWIESNVFVTADGGPCGGGSTDISSYAGLSGIKHASKNMFLAGVFLTSEEPIGAAPETLDFSNNSSFASIAPKIGQIFYIGDGLTGSGNGDAQKFYVPPTATRLFLGFADGYNFTPCCYGDNQGALTASFDITRPADADVTGPSISDLKLNGLTLAEGSVVSKSGSLTLTALDAAGVSRVEVLIDGVLVSSATGSSTFNASFNMDNLANGLHTITLRAYDSLGNASNTSYQFTVAHAAPDAPILSEPSHGLVTRFVAQTLTGTAKVGTTVQAYLNGVATGTPVAAGSDGRFVIGLTLIAGNNTIQATARNQYGESALSSARTVNVDLSVPMTPSNLAVASQASGKIKLSWNINTDSSTASYDVYRATASFNLIAEAIKLNSSAITINSFEDAPANDGSYFYRVVARNHLGALSEPSNMAQAVVDATPPKAISILYKPQGKVDVATGNVGQGRVDIVLTVSEALGFSPYLAIVPQGGQPIPVELSKATDTVYNGSFVIDANTLSGEAHALFSARDVVGNRGTQIDVGSTLKIDTTGPAVLGITIAPVSPIKNHPTQTITATFITSEAVKAGETPQITALLSGALRTAITATNVSKVDAGTWQASIVLPTDAGLPNPENLVFSWRALDDLDNVSSKITASNRFQVYQGELPPLDVPLNFTAKAMPGGKVNLAWQAVAEAAAYQIYRQAPGEATLSAYQRVSALSYTDQTVQDGTYKYALATVRKAGEDESISGQTAAIEVKASNTAPGAPQNLSLQVTSQGLLASWQAPLASQVASYNLYRGAGLSLTSIAGLAPIKTGIRQTLAIDANPSATDHAYVVTALDAAGNESVISNSAYLNATLLPVSTLKVEQTGNNLPVISWTASRTSVAGYNVYLGAENALLKLTATPSTALTFIDSGFTAGERRYTVAATDANGVEMPRSIVMPNVLTQIASGLPLKRGLMNRVQIQVSNSSSGAISNARVLIELGGHAHRSEVINLAANETRLVNVVVGGYSTLTSQETAKLGIEITPNEGELVKITRSTPVDVIEGALQVSLSTESFTRGAMGKVRMKVENTSDVEVELLAARNNVADSSSEMRFKLLDSDGNVLSTQAFKQVSGANIVTLANGQTVARIPAAASYASDVFDVNVPAGSPDKIRVQVEIDKIRYHSGQDDEVQIPGKKTEVSVSLLDTAYYGEVNTVEPLNSFGDSNITITGRALDRQSSQLLPNSTLKLILNQQGFERAFQVVTDATGKFSYTFKPTLTDVGLYKVSAVHPDITDRPEQKAFTINRVTVGPSTYNLTVPRNYTFNVPLTGVSGVGTSANNLRLVMEAAAQPSGKMPDGISLTMPNPVTISQRQSLSMPVIFTADNTAVSPGSVVLRAYADESPSKPLGQVTLNYTLSEAKPYLSASPSYIETGMAMGGSEIENVVISNNGQQDAFDLQFTLLNQDGSVAPDWVKVASQANGTLAVGGKRSIDLSFTPSAAVPEGVYRFKLRITGSNITEQNMNIFASVTQSGVGSVMFKAADIYTATLDAQRNIIPGLAGARLLVQNEDVATISRELVTDNLGEAMFTDLPAGRYKYKATAANHQETTGRFAIKPSVILSQPIFLDYNLVTVDWSVKEISLEDRYDIVINTTYQTNVPAAVLVLQPASVSIPTLKAGEMFHGELTLTNYGLVAGNNLTHTLPKGNEYFKFDFLVEVPKSMAAKSRLTIPYRITALKSLEEQGNASGAGCWSHSFDYGLDYKYTCSNGDERSGTARTYWTSNSASTCPVGTTSNPNSWTSSVSVGTWGTGGIGGGSSSGTTTEIPNAPSCAACSTGKCCTTGGAAPK